MTTSMPPNEAAVEVFWNATRSELQSARWEEFFGLRVRSTLRPPAVQLADDAQEATALARKVASDTLHHLATPTVDFGGELPDVGDLMIVCDGLGQPVALVQTTEVSTDGENITETLECLFPEPAKKKKR